jgi:hypothetical protein
MFNQALKWELYEGRNPAASPGMLREVHHDKYLSPAETRALVSALDADKDQTAAAVLALLIVTGRGHRHRNSLPTAPGGERFHFP